jgi:6-phosphogluconolactonase
LQQISCGGATPRHLAFDPTGNFLLVANQNSDKISVFHAAPSKSPLSPAAHDMHIGSPMCVKFLTQARGA